MTGSESVELGFAERRHVVARGEGDDVDLGLHPGGGVVHYGGAHIDKWRPDR
jgi:hypothetical protein